MVAREAILKTIGYVMEAFLDISKRSITSICPQQDQS